MMSREDLTIKFFLFILLHIFIVFDIIAITIVMIWDVPARVAYDIQIFDTILCIVLLTEWAINFHRSTPKITFLKQKDNIIDLIASIPFDVVLPAIIPSVAMLRYLRLLKLLRIVALFNRFFNGFKKFLKDSKLDKVISLAIFTIIIFTVLFYLFGSSYGLIDDFYFVIVTLTTVGYGDITPITFNEKLITIFLISAGILIFSTITASISSYLTERLVNEDTQEVDDKLDEIMDELKIIREENKELKTEIKKLRGD